MVGRGTVSDSEMAILQVLWGVEGPLTAVEITQLLAEDKGWKIGTIYSFLNRLEEKGMLHTARRGKTNHYTPALSQEEYRRMETTDFLKAVHDGRISSLCAALGQQGLDRQDIDELRRWLDSMED